MATIIQLSPQLASMIAAGEVVERPSSVVKELVENSLDAGSTSIKIDLLDSGLKKITVLDNGCGMSSEDILLALMRHATSKIKTADDLFRITSLGFRGEALPSIASISMLTITSNPSIIEGYFYQVKAGDVINHGPTQMPKGTKIEVENLFFNTPARYKHLGNTYQEQSAIVEYLYKLALSHPNVAFTLTNNNKLLFNTSGSNDILEIITAAYGIDTAKALVAFHGSNNLYHIHGFTTNNQVFRSNRNAINIIVNGRIIRNLKMIYAVSDAYQTLLPVGKYPVTTLFIEANPLLIDVNVHPSKLEIRFTDEQDLKRLITNTIYSNLTMRPLFESNSVLKEEPSIELLKTDNDSTLINTSIDKSIDIWDLFKDAPINDELLEELSEEVKPQKEEYVQVKMKEPTLFFQNLTYLGQYHQTYLLFEDEDNLYLLDQHAAMERIMYEKISKEFEEINRQGYDLLIPMTIDFSLSEIPLILNLIDELKAMGIAIEPFGGTTIIVRTIPDWIPKSLEVEFVSDIINHLINDRLANKQKMYDTLAKSLSCKQSIKANMKISYEEVKELLIGLDKCRMPYTCPHGRPTLIKFSNYEIEKMFKRVI